MNGEEEGGGTGSVLKEGEYGRGEGMILCSQPSVCVCVCVCVRVCVCV